MQNEYYINDAGSQIDNFAESIYAQYKKSKGIEVKISEDGYKGNYIDDIASNIASSSEYNIEDMSEKTALNCIKDYGLNLMLTSIKQDLKSLRVHMDEWFSEKSLFENGTYDEIKSKLEKIIYYKKEITHYGLNHLILEMTKIM